MYLFWHCRVNFIVVNNFTNIISLFSLNLKQRLTAPTSSSHEVFHFPPPQNVTLFFYFRAQVFTASFLMANRSSHLVLSAHVAGVFTYTYKSKRLDQKSVRPKLPFSQLQHVGGDNKTEYFDICFIFFVIDQGRDKAFVMRETSFEVLDVLSENCLRMSNLKTFC